MAKKHYQDLTAREAEICVSLANNWSQEVNDQVESILEPEDFDLLCLLAENYVWFGSNDVTRSATYTVQLDGHFSPKELKLIAFLAENTPHA